MNNYSFARPSLGRELYFSTPKPRPYPIPRPKPERLPRRRGVTIAIHLSGQFSLVTATDTQGTYDSGEKVDTGKIIGSWRAMPLGAINIAGAGDASYIKALSQEIDREFKKFNGTIEGLETRFREISGAFYNEHVFPFEGKRKRKDIPDYSLLVAVTHEHESKLWNIEGTLLTESSNFDCIGIGSPVAESLLNRLYPMYPTIDSLAVLAAYVIWRVKASVDACGLNTEIRIIHQEKPVLVAAERILAWESLFRRYDKLERGIFYHAMNFIVRPPEPPVAMQESMRKTGHPDHSQAFPPQMKPLSEINEEIAAIRAEFAKSPIFKAQ
jgi:hypothetical protein